VADGKTCESCRVWKFFGIRWRPYATSPKFRVLRYSVLLVLLGILVVGYQLLKPRTFVFTQSIMVYSAAAMLLLMMYHVADPAEHRRLVYARYISLAAVAGMFLVGTYFNMPGCVFYCTIDDFGSVLSVLVIIVGAFIMPLAWCRYICPEGAVLGLCGKGARKQVIRNEEACVECGKCAWVCDMQAISEDITIDTSSCIMCGKCIDICPTNALSYGTVGDPAAAPAAAAPSGKERLLPTLRRWLVPACLIVAAVVSAFIARSRLTPTVAAPVGGTGAFSSPPALAQQASEEWAMFGADSTHSGQSAADFPSANLKTEWVFTGSNHTWAYRKQASVWSASPVIAKVDDRWLLITGSYDRSVYALNARTGERVWRVSTGDSIFSAPAIGRIGDRTIVYVASTDHRIYAYDARNGELVWGHEALEWTDTVAPAITASPAFTYVGDTPLLAVSIHLNDQFGPRNVQEGKIILFHAETGSIIWEKTLSKSPVTSPIIANVKGHAAVIVLSTDGVLYCFDAMTGTEAWRSLLLDLSYASPSFADVEGIPTVFIGSRFHTMYSIDAQDGQRIWQRRSNNFIDGTAAVGQVDGKPVIVYGSYDRRVYCTDARTSKIRWHARTGNDICATPAIVTVNQRPAVIAHSLDDHLYMFDLATGEELWKHFVGNVVWSHIERTDSIWSSPAAAVVDGQAMLFFGSYDGQFYAFSANQEADR